MITARTILILGCAIALSACSGSGSGNSNRDRQMNPPAQPSVSIQADTKQLVISWNRIAGADYYRVLENPDGHSGYMQLGGDVPADTVTFNRSIAVHLFDWVNAQYMVEACNEIGCAGSNSVTATDMLLDTIGYLKPASLGRSRFGQAVEISAAGNVLAVAGGIWPNQAVYLFRTNGSGWAQEERIESPSHAPDEEAWADTFALSGDGNLLVVGAMDWQGSPGRVYSYRYDGEDWSQSTVFKGCRDCRTYDVENGDLFGERITLSSDGNTLAVVAGNTGTVFIYRFDGVEWQQQSSISFPVDDLYFGVDVSLSADGDTLAVGANDEPNRTHSRYKGAVHIFRYDNAEWTRQARINSPNTDFDDNFFRVDLSADGNVLAVGSYGEDSSATGINGDELDNSMRNSGAVYVYRFNGTDWAQQAYIKASNASEIDIFGWNIALDADGSTLAVGASREDGRSLGINGDQNDETLFDSGAVYLFRSIDNDWSQFAYIKAPNTGEGDNFGGIALSADGEILVVGAPGEDSSATGLNGDQLDNSAEDSGAIYIY